MIPLLFFLISFIWVPVDDGYEKIPIVYGEIMQCGSYLKSNGDWIKGCYDNKKGQKQISFDPQFVFARTIDSTVWDHEVMHAWGMSHAEMRWHFVEGQYR
jgi:hypothetical protein